MLLSLLLPVAALGHFCLTVLTVNILHGLGLPEGGMRSIKALSVGWLIGVGGVLVAVAMPTARPGWVPVVEAYGFVCLMTAGVGLPLVTVRRLRRRRPDGIRGTSRVIDLAGPEGKSRLIGRGVDALWLRLPGNQAFELEISEWEVELTRLPESWDGLAILQLSDLHLAPAYDRTFFRRALESAAGIEADLVVFTGDLIDDDRMLEGVGELLGGFRGRLGQYAILGNHDHRFDLAGPRAALEGAGFDVLDGAWKRIADVAGTLAVGGTCYPWGPWLPGPPPEADLTLLLCHSPDGLYRAARLGVQFMLSGHTHGGQYRIPGIGPVLMPSIYSRRLDAGFFREGETLLYVSRGIAAQHPLRVNCRPEISRFVLRSPSRVVKPGGLHRSRVSLAGESSRG